MAERAAYLEAIVGADVTAFRRGMQQVRNEVGILGDSLSGISGIGRTLTFTVTTPLVAMGSAAVVSAMQFEEAMRNVNSIAGLAEDDFADLSAAVLQFGSDTRFGATEAAGALYTVFSAGLTDSALAMEFMEASSIAAQAGMADLNSTTETLVGQFLAFGGAALPMNEQLAMATEYADGLAQMVMIGVGTMDEFGTALAQVTPGAAALNVEANELYGTLAYLTQRGLGASTAATSLNAALTALLKPTDAMAAAYDELNVSGGQDLIETFGSVEGALRAVLETTDGGADAVAELFGNVRAMRAVNLLGEDFEGWSDALETFGETVDGAAGRAQQEQMKSFAAQWDLLKAAIEGAGIAIGQQIIPIITPIVQFFTDAASAVGDLSPELVQLGVAFGGAVALAAPLLWILPSLLNPIGLLIGAVTALGVAFAADFGGIRTIVEDTLSGIVGDTSELGSLVEDVMGVLFPEETAAAEATSALDNFISGITLTEVGASDFVTVAEGDTLWSIWEDGYSGQFTWDEFKDAVGWGDTLHELHPGDIIEIPTSFRGEFLDQFAGQSITVGDIWNALTGQGGGSGRGEQFDYHNVDDSFTDMSGSIADSLLDRLIEAGGLIAGRIGEVLSPILESMRAWFDTNVGKGIDWLAGLFSGAGTKGGSTPLSAAFEALLDGNFTAAINAVIPGLGTSIAEGLAGLDFDFSKAFPHITAALGTLITNVGNWLVNEALPTLGNMGGSLAGHLASGLYDAVQGVVKFLEGGKGGDIAGSIVAYFTDTLIPSIATGFATALEGTDLATEGIPAFKAAFDQFSADIESALTKVTEVLDLLGVDDLVLSLGNLAEGVIGFATNVAGADWSGVGDLLEIGAKIAGFVLMIGNTAIAGLINGIADGLPILGDAVAGILNALAGIGDVSPGEILKDLAGGIEQFLLSLLMIPAGIIDEIIRLFEEISHLDVRLPDLTDTITRWAADIQADMDSVYVDPVVMVSPGSFTYDASADPNFTGLNIFGENIQNAVRAYLAENPVEVGDAPLNISISDTAPITFDPMAATSNLLQLPGAVPAEASAVEVTITAGAPVTLAGGGQAGAAMIGGNVLNIPTAQAEIGALTLDTTNTVATLSGGADVIPEAVLPTGEVERHLATEIDTAATAAATQLANTFMAGGIVDPNVVINNFLVPLDAAWTDYFGVGGLMPITLSTFAVNAGVTLATVGGAFFLLEGAVILAMGGAAAIIDTNVGLIIDDMGQLREELLLVQGSFEAVGTAAGAALPAGADTGSSSYLDGGLAEGGRAVGGGRYLVGEEGAELFVPRSSGTVIPHDVLSSMGNSGGGEAVSQNNEVHFHQTMNLNDQLYEMRRRGLLTYA